MKGLAARRIGRSGSLAAILFAVLALMASASASATTFDFCGTSSNPHYFSNVSDRCADSNYHRFIFTRAYSNVYDSKCAIVKEYPDGSGLNDTAPACGLNSTYMQSDCSSPYSCAGYATITDDGVLTSYGYWGYAEI